MHQCFWVKLRESIELPITRVCSRLVLFNPLINNVDERLETFIIKFEDYTKRRGGMAGIFEKSIKILDTHFSHFVWNWGNFEGFPDVFVRKVNDDTV